MRRVRGGERAYEVKPGPAAGFYNSRKEGGTAPGIE